MSRILLAKEIFDIPGAAFARIERTGALVYFATKRIELFDMREQLSADLFLVGIRQPGDLRNGLFASSDHGYSLAHSTFRGYPATIAKQAPPHAHRIAKISVTRPLRAPTPSPAEK